MEKETMIGRIKKASKKIIRSMVPLLLVGGMVFLAIGYFDTYDKGVRGGHGAKVFGELRSSEYLLCCLLKKPISSGFSGMVIL